MNFLLRIVGAEVDREVLFAPSVRELVCGRDAEADIVLANDKFISRRHAALHNDGESLTLRVISSNGVVGPRGLIACGESIQLSAGDEFSIGSYRLHVSAAGDSGLQVATRSSDTPSTPGARSRSELIWSEPLPAPTQTPPALPPSPGSREAPSSSNGQPDLPSPFDVLDRYRSSTNGTGSSPSAPPPSPGLRMGTPPVPGGPAGEQVPSGRSMDLLQELSRQGPLAHLLKRHEEETAPKGLSPAHVHAFKKPYVADATDPLPHLPPLKSSQSPVEQPPIRAPHSPSNHWEAFARGLGLDPAATQTPLAAEEAGKMVRRLVEAITDLQASRADLKKELQIRDRTMVSGRDNNPFKWLSVDEIIQYMFAEQAGIAFMPAERALRETLLELRVHESSTALAARAAVEGALREFDPGLLREQFQKRGATSRFRLLESARLWNAYVEDYEKESLHMADWLERIFNKYFSSTYSDETQRLKASKATPVPGPISVSRPDSVN